MATRTHTAIFADAICEEERTAIQAILDESPGLGFYLNCFWGPASNAALRAMRKHGEKWANGSKLTEGEGVS